MNKPVPEYGTVILLIDGRIGVYYGLQRYLSSINFWMLDLGGGKTGSFSEWECDILDRDLLPVTFK